MTVVRPWLIPSAVALTATVVAAASLSMGPASPTFLDVPRALLGTHSDPDAILIVRQARLPRTALAMLAGAALAAAGTLLQAVTRNPLASPSVLGIGAGANLMLLLTVVAFPGLGEAGVLGACFLGAVASAGIIGLCGFSPEGRLDRDRLLVAGSVLAALETGATACILFLHGMQHLLLGWTLGRLVNVSPEQVLWILPPIVAGMAAAAVLAPRLETLGLGESGAAALGIRVGALQAGALFAAVLLAASAVAGAGPVPFVGLIAPHLVSRVRVPFPALRVPVVAAVGATLAGAADLLSRSVGGARSVPLGLWMMALGSVFFLIRTGRR